MPRRVEPRRDQPGQDLSAKGATPLPRRRRWQFRLGILALLLLLLAALELGARLHYKGRFPNQFVAHPRRIYANRPHWRGFDGKKKHDIQVRINGLGLRDDRELLRRFDGRRVLVLGDSVIFGYRQRYEETVTQLMEASLTERAGRWQVLNGGCYGYGIDQESAWFDELGAALETDLVILSICYNDFGQLFDPRPAVEWGSGVIKQLEDGSALFMGIRRKVHQARRKLLKRLGRLPSRQEVRTRFVISREQAATAAALMAERVRALERKVTGLGGRLAIVIWPSQDQLLHFSETGQAPAEQLRLVTELRAQEPQLPIVSPLEKLKQFEDVASLYLDHCHPSAKGTQALADQLIELIEAHFP